MMIIPEAPFPARVVENEHPRLFAPPPPPPDPVPVVASVFAGVPPVAIFDTPAVVQPVPAPPPA